jgi:hypothetical protein
MKKTIIIISFLLITILLTSSIGAKDREGFKLPKFGTDFSGTIQSTKESGVELIREYPHRWGSIEPYEPDSKQIVPNLVNNCHKEIVIDRHGKKHFFDWTYPDIRAARALAAGKTLYFSIHETNRWGSDEACVKYVTDVLKNINVNCPMKDEQSLNHFRFFVRRFVERFDNDGVDDIDLNCISKRAKKFKRLKNPQKLNQAVKFWQLGAEYDSYDNYYHGTPEEYLIVWKTFSETVRSENPNALIVSNGIAQSPAQIKKWEQHGKLPAGLTFADYKWSYVPTYFSAEEIVRARNITKRPFDYPMINDVLSYLDLKDGVIGNEMITKKRKIESVRSTLQKRKHHIEFLYMVLDNPSLYDIFEVRAYTFYKYNPDRIPNDLRIIKEEMAKRGYNKPITTGEASGAFLSPRNTLAHRMERLINSYKKKAIYGVNPGPVTIEEREAYKYYMAEQSREVVKVHTKYFAAGGDMFIKWRFTDWLPNRVDKATPNFGILGLVYPSAFKLREELRKPVFYTYKLMTSKLKGFTKAEYINNDSEQIMFTFRDKAPVFVLWRQGNRTHKVDLSSYVSTPYIKITRIVTELDDDWNPIYPHDVVIPTGPVTIDEKPVFVEGTTDPP